MKLSCSKDMLYPCYRTVCSESSKLSCSTYVLARAQNLVAFQFFKKIPPFYYSVAMVSLREPAKVRDTRRRFSALSQGAVRRGTLGTRLSGYLRGSSPYDASSSYTSFEGVRLKEF